MKTVQMILDEATVAEVDKAVKRLGTTRSAFTRQALRQALARLETSLLEEKQRRGYLKRPVTRGEFSGWESEQVWEEE